MKKLSRSLISLVFVLLFLVSFIGCSIPQFSDQNSLKDENFSGDNSDYSISSDYSEQTQKNAVDFSALYEDTYRSVVTVCVDHENTGAPTAGTGIIIDSDNGYLLTSSSLFEYTAGNRTYKTDCSVRLYNGDICNASLQGYAAQRPSMFGNFYGYFPVGGNSSFPLEMALETSNSDLAIAKIDGVSNGRYVDSEENTQKELPSAAQFEDSDTLIYGEDCYTISAVAHEEDILSGVMNEGIITKPFNTHSTSFTILTNTQILREEDFFDGSFDYLIQTGVTINSGSEGAPLFNGEGKLIGMMNLRVSETYIYSENDPYGISFATPSQTIYKLANQAGINLVYDDQESSRESCIANATELYRYRATNDIDLSLMNRYPDYFIVNESAPVQFTSIEQEAVGNTSVKTAAEQLDKTVKILAYSEDGLSEGSGFLIDKSGYILTNLHVINSLSEQNQEKGEIANATVSLAEKFYCLFERGTMSDGSFVVMPMEIIAYHQQGDLAILRFKNPISHIEGGISRDGFASACSFEKTLPSVGERVTAIGNALGYGVSVATGIVSLPEFKSYYSLYGYNMIQTDCPINSGNSGGGLFDSSGKVIGINTLGLAIDGYDNVSWAIPANFAVSFIEDVNQGRSSKNIKIYVQNVKIDLM